MRSKYKRLINYLTRYLVNKCERLATRKSIELNRYLIKLAEEFKRRIES